MSTEWVSAISERYIELYEQITGDIFQRYEGTDVSGRIVENIKSCLAQLSA